MAMGFELWAMGSGLTNSTITFLFLSPGGRGSLPLLKNFERQARRGGYITTLPFVPPRLSVVKGGGGMKNELR